MVKKKVSKKKGIDNKNLILGVVVILLLIGVFWYFNNQKDVGLAPPGLEHGFSPGLERLGGTDLEFALEDAKKLVEELTTGGRRTLLPNTVGLEIRIAEAQIDLVRAAEAVYRESGSLASSSELLDARLAADDAARAAREAADEVLEIANERAIRLGTSESSRLVANAAEDVARARQLEVAAAENLPFRRGTSLAQREAAEQAARTIAREAGQESAERLAREIAIEARETMGRRVIRYGGYTLVIVAIGSEYTVAYYETPSNWAQDERAFVGLTGIAYIPFTPDWNLAEFLIQALHIGIRPDIYSALHTHEDLVEDYNDLGEIAVCIARLNAGEEECLITPRRWLDDRPQRASTLGGEPLYPYTTEDMRLLESMLERASESLTYNEISLRLLNAEVMYVNDYQDDRDMNRYDPYPIEGITWHEYFESRVFPAAEQLHNENHPEDILYGGQLRDMFDSTNLEENIRADEILEEWRKAYEQNRRDMGL